MTSERPRRPHEFWDKRSKVEHREFLRRLASATAGLMLTGARSGGRASKTAERQALIEKVADLAGPRAEWYKG